MFTRKYNKQNKFKRFLLKLLKVYAYEKETLNVVNPNYKNQMGNFVNFNDKSFNFNQGYLNLTRKIKKLDIFFRYAPNVDLWNSSKSWKRIIQGINKEDLISISLLSLKKSILYFLKKNDLEITVHLISDNSNTVFDNHLLKLIENDNIKVILHKSKIPGNRGSYLECCDNAEYAEDLIFFIEDDYLFEEKCIEETLITYSRVSTLLKKEIIICPSDYSFYYDSLYKTSLLIGKDYRWRIVGETLLTFMLSKKTFNQYKKSIRMVGEKENNPFEKPLHEIYQNVTCIAPVNSLSYHISRSVPSVTENWKKTWDDIYINYINLKSINLR